MSNATTVLAIALLFVAQGALAQVGDISNVNWPNWEPADKVAPALTTEAIYDTATELWQYTYILGNGADAEQDIMLLRLRYNAPDTTSEVIPAPGWKGHAAPAPYAMIPGVAFRAIPQAGISSAPRPRPAQIAPGASLSGFSVSSRYPPGYARTYVQGFVSVPYVSEDDLPSPPIIVPHDTTNSQRAWSLGPTLYTEILTLGTTEAVNANGFLGFMNLELLGTVLMDPAPIALELSVGGETVFPETFQATLNGIDVTQTFSPGASEGADLAAVFDVPSSPLLTGDNVLETSIEGLIPGTTTRAIDADVITFQVKE